MPQKLLGFEESVRAALAAEARHAVAARWTEGAFMFRDYRPDYAYYAKHAGGETRTGPPLAALWRVVTAIGGDNRYYAYNFLWTLREMADWLVGGIGLHHGRRDPDHLRVGDVIDSWRVIGVEPERRLTLAFGMKAPGAGVLEFEIEETAPGRAPHRRDRPLASRRRVGPRLLVRDVSGAPRALRCAGEGNRPPRPVADV